MARAYVRARAYLPGDPTELNRPQGRIRRRLPTFSLCTFVSDLFIYVQHTMKDCLVQKCVI